MNNWARCRPWRSVMRNEVNRTPNVRSRSCSTVMIGVDLTSGGPSKKDAQNQVGWVPNLGGNALAIGSRCSTMRLSVSTSLPCRLGTTPQAAVSP